MQIENDENYWKYSNTTEPFSKETLYNFISEQKHDIFEVKQKRFIVSSQKSQPWGLWTF